MNQKRWIRITLIFIIIFVTVFSISYFVFPNWSVTSNGFWLLTVAVLSGVLATIKDVISIIKDLGEIGAGKSNTKDHSEAEKLKEFHPNPQINASDIKHKKINGKLSESIDKKGQVNMSKLNTSELRRILANRFDDPGLDAFCQDYFPVLYNKFSRGMRKDEKISLLLDHCNRDTVKFEKLQKLIQQG